MWQDWINVVLGFCVIVVAFLGLDQETLTWTLSILGAAIVLLGLWEAVTISQKQMV